MKFVLIKANERLVEFMDAEDVTDCYQAVGLERDHVDHGTVAHRSNGGIAIVVYEYGLMEPPASHSFFSIGSQLFAGNAVLYGFDGQGETVNLTVKVPVMFYRSSKEAEAAIQRGHIQRPCTAVNGVVLWQWKG